MAKQKQTAPAAPQPEAALPDPTRPETAQPETAPERPEANQTPPNGDTPLVTDALPPGMVRAWVVAGPVLLGENERHHKGAEIVLSEADAAAIKHHLTFDPPTKETA